MSVKPWYQRMFSSNGHSRQSLSDSVRTVPVRIRAKYDAAQDTTDNANQWVNADTYSADTGNSVTVRNTLRKRARYEVANNSYAKGIVLTIANDLVGTGPTLQLQTQSTGFNAMVEREFWNWSSRVNLARKLRTMIQSRIVDGEAFAVLRADTRAPEGVVSLDIKLIEAEQVATPYLSILDPNKIDGITFDELGNPVSYDVLPQHPGGSSYQLNLTPVEISARYMLHLFREDRPGQHRGIPEITPALSLFSKLRSYTDSVVNAAQTAADMVAVCETDMPPNNEADLVTPLDTVELEKRVMTTLPMGWKLSQLKAEQPTTMYGDFKNQIINEIARCLNMPFNVAACNSASYNYASGRLDHQVYFRSLRVDQSHMEAVVLDRLFAEWFKEAALVFGWGVPRDTAPPHQWFWPGLEHVDPTKEADAQTTRLQNHTTTLAREYAKEGLDWESELNQRSLETKRMKELGLTPAEAAPKKPPQQQEMPSDANA